MIIIDSLKLTILLIIRKVKHQSILKYILKNRLMICFQHIQQLKNLLGMMTLDYSFLQSAQTLIKVNSIKKAHLMDCLRTSKLKLRTKNIWGINLTWLQPWMIQVWTNLGRFLLSRSQRKNQMWTYQVKSNQLHWVGSRITNFWLNW